MCTCNVFAATPDVFVLREAREFHYYKETPESEHSRHSSVQIELTVIPRPDGSYMIGGTFAFFPGKAPDFDGYGEMGKDGVIHFPWMDSFFKVGDGTLRFLKDGKKAALLMGPKEDYPEWILDWNKKTVNVEPASLVTEPAFLLPPETIYQSALEDRSQADATFKIKPLKGKKVTISGIVSFSSKRVEIEGKGEWKAGTIILFTFTDNLKHTGRGEISFDDLDHMVPYLIYTPRVEDAEGQMVSEFGTSQRPLIRQK